MTTDINEWHETTDIETQLEDEADLELDAVESPDDVSASNSCFQGKSKAQELKEKISFVSLLNRDGHSVTGSGTWKKCLCPFHDDNNPSFSVNEETNWARCWSCDWKGDIYAYEMETHKIGFYEAFQQLEKKARHIRRKTPLDSAIRPASGCAEVVLTTEQIEIQQKAAKRLAEDFDLCCRVAEKRGWNPETIQKLAADGSLGWNQGALAFLYDTGMKLRDWPKREWIWEFGRACVWRRKRIAAATDIFLCEGETDAISLVDKGLEEDPTYAVVAIQGATTLSSDLVDLLRGKHVTICMDNDAAGETALYKLNDLLEPVCASVSTINYGEGDSNE